MEGFLKFYLGRNCRHQVVEGGNMTNTADQPSHFTHSKFVKTVEELNLNLVRKKVRYPLITETATEGCFFFLVFYQTS